MTDGNEEIWGWVKNREVEMTGDAERRDVRSHAERGNEKTRKRRRRGLQIKRIDRNPSCSPGSLAARFPFVLADCQGAARRALGFCDVGDFPPVRVSQELRGHRSQNQSVRRKKTFEAEFLGERARKMTKFEPQLAEDRETDDREMDGCVPEPLTIGTRASRLEETWAFSNREGCARPPHDWREPLTIEKNGRKWHGSAVSHKLDVMFSECGT
jgi:hypothetical protein